MSKPKKLLLLYFLLRNRLSNYLELNLTDPTTEELYYVFSDVEEEKIDKILKELKEEGLVNPSVSKKESKEIEQTVERMEKFGTLEKQFKGRGVKPSESAKLIAKNLPKFKDRRISAIEIQHLINNFESRGIDYQYVDFNAILDTSLEVKEAKKLLL